jgi:hypothetical protein
VIFIDNAGRSFEVYLVQRDAPLFDPRFAASPDGDIVDTERIGEGPAVELDDGSGFFVDDVEVPTLADELRGVWARTGVVLSVAGGLYQLIDSFVSRERPEPQPAG